MFQQSQQNKTKQKTWPYHFSRTRYIAKFSKSMAQLQYDKGNSKA